MQNYLAARGKGTPYSSVACSGALVGDLNGSGASGQNQLKAAEKELADAEYVSVSIGGNDTGFQGTITSCLLIRQANGQTALSPQLNSFDCSKDVLASIDPNSTTYKWHPEEELDRHLHRDPGEGTLRKDPSHWYVLPAPIRTLLHEPHH